jgi:hypothetical protein
MNPTGKKFIALFLMLSLMMLSANLYAKQRRGAKLIVIKKDGGQIEGELITVKPNSLLLLDTAGKDVSVDVEEIKVIKIVYKKLAAVGWSVLGFSLTGASTGAVFAVFPGFIVAAIEGVSVSSLMVEWGAIGALVGAIVGAIVGVVVKPVETIKIEGKSDKKIKKALKKLRKKARVRNYK